MRIHRLYRPVLLVLILALAVVLLTACDPVAGHYPCQLGHGWVSDDPNIVMDTWRAEDGIWHYGGEKIIMDGKEIVVQVAYHVHSVFIYPEGPVYAKAELIKGTWKIKDGCLIIEVTQDNIFDGKYTKLVFRSLDADGE